MALIPRNITNIAKGGLVADAVQGLGVGTIINVADKKLLNGKMTAAGVSIGQTLNAKPLCLNVTDALTWLLVAGPTIKKGALMKGGIAVVVKKVFEAFDYIDPPVVTPAGQTTTAINYPSVQNTNTAQLFAGGRV